MPRQLSDAVELLRFEAELEELCMSAFRSWAPEVEAAVLPELEGIVASLVAAGSDLPPMPEGVGDVGPAWKRLLLIKIMPGVEKLVLRRLASRMEKSGAAEAAKIARADLPADPLLTTIYGGRKSRDARTVYQLPSQRQWQADYLADVENRMSDTPDTVFRAIAAEVAAGTSKGESIPKLRDRVHTLLRGNNLAMWRGRATTIARTEAVGAFNGATLRAAIAQQVLLGVELEKAWVCVHPDSVVLSDEAQAIARKPYSGPMVTVRTARNAAAFTVTPDHQVLTAERGWVAAADLREGDGLLYVGWGHTVGCPQVQNGPSSVGEVAGAVLDMPAPNEVRPVGGGMDLHVQRPDGNVEVVRADRELVNRVHPRVGEGSAEVEFMLPDMAAAALFAGRATPESVVAHGAPGEGRATSGVSGGLGVGGFAGGAEFPGSRLVADSGVALAKNPADSWAAAPELGGDSLHRHTGLVQVDDVLGVEVSSFSGHVYDLQTVSEWFTCNNYIVHNCTIDGRTRKTHFAADGQRRPLDGKFKVGRANLDRPGDPRGPAEEVVNCVVGSTQVGWAGQDVTHATRRSYRGSLLHLRTADGHQLSITPNHPVLTRSGYIPAGLLQPGDYLVTSGPAPSPYVDDGPPRIDEFYRASSIVREPQRVSGGGVHFHGDAAKGEGVDVVRTDSSLRDGRYARAPHSFEEFDLVRLHDRARGLTAGSAGQGRTGAVSAVTPVGLGAGAASGVVRGAGSGSTLLDGEALSGDSVGFGGGSDTQAVLLQAANDCRAADPEAATHLRHAHALGMKFSQLIHIDRTLGDHDVYNLHTTENYYTANNIAVHNCRCTIIEVEPGDALPGETDRQTERGPGDATVRNRSGSRQDEIDRRAADGVIRARDDDGGDGIVAAATGGEPMEREWTGVLAPLGKPTGDGRMFDENMAVSFRDFPLPLMWQQQTSDFPHSQAYTVGSIREATVEGGVIKASGILFATPEADEAEAQLKEGVTRPSVDLCDDTWELRDGDGNLIDPEAMWDMTEEELADVVMCFTAATVMGATLVAKPAFAEAKIEVGGEVDEDEDKDAPEDETDDADKPEETEDTDAEPEETDDEDKTKAAVGSSTVAAPSVTEAEQALLAAAPLRPQFDAGLFSDPGLTEPTRLQYDPKTGRVWGHVATWGVCHLGVRDKCIMAPTSAQQYAQFHTHEVDTADGPLAVGVLSYGSGHANPRAGLSVALEHYDNAATAWAFVRAGEDATGVWVSGVVSPFADPEEVSMALTAPLSGDWRRVGGSLELCAALSVNTPGFHPGGAHDEQGRPLSLVAAGVVPVEKREASAAFRSMVAAAVREELGRQQRHAALTASAGARGLLPTPVPSDDDRARRARALALKMGRR